SLRRLLPATVFSALLLLRRSPDRAAPSSRPRHMRQAPFLHSAHCRSAAQSLLHLPPCSVLRISRRPGHAASRPALSPRRSGRVLPHHAAGTRQPDKIGDPEELPAVLFPDKLRVGRVPPTQLRR